MEKMEKKPLKRLPRKPKPNIMTGGLGDPGSKKRKRNIMTGGLDELQSKSSKKVKFKFADDAKMKPKKKTFKYQDDTTAKRKDMLAISANPKNKKSVTPKKTKTFSSFGSAFKDARKRLGAGKTFTYKGKKYSTNLASDKKAGSAKTIANKPTPRPKAARNTKASKMGLDGPKVGVRNGSKPKKKTSNVMSTKTSKFFKGTNITPTKTQRQRMRKRMMGST